MPNPNAQERAEKILKVLDKAERLWIYSQVDIDLIAAELDAYAEEKYQQGRDISLLEERHRIRVEEREACAKVAEKYTHTSSKSDPYIMGWYRGAAIITKEIRSRGEA